MASRTAINIYSPKYFMVMQVKHKYFGSSRMRGTALTHTRYRIYVRFKFMYVT